MNKILSAFLSGLTVAFIFIVLRPGPGENFFKEREGLTKRHNCFTTLKKSLKCDFLISVNPTCGGNVAESDVG